MNCNIDDLFLFAKISNYYSLNDAAKDLGWTPSSLTRFIQKLEATLGHPLIITTRNGFVPSYFGRAIRNRFGTYNQIFDAEIVNILGSVKKYRATFNIGLSIALSDYVIGNLLKITQNFSDVSFNFFINDGFSYIHNPNFFNSIHFGLIATPRKNSINDYVLSQSTYISRTYFEAFCTDDYMNTYGIPSDLEQLQKHHTRITTSIGGPVYAYLEGPQEPFLIAQQAAITVFGGRLHALIKTGHYIGIGISQALYREFISITPKYNFGVVNGYLFENKVLTRQYPIELIELISSTIIESCKTFEKGLWPAV